MILNLDKYYQILLIKCPSIYIKDVVHHLGVATTGSNHQ